MASSARALSFQFPQSTAKLPEATGGYHRRWDRQRGDQADRRLYGCFGHPLGDQRDRFLATVAEEHDGRGPGDEYGKIPVRRVKKRSGGESLYCPYDVS